MKRRPVRPIVMIATLALLAFALQGCGQKGPLYLPEKASEVVTRPSQTPVDTAPVAAEAPPADVTQGDALKKDDADKKEKDAASQPR